MNKIIGKLKRIKKTKKISYGFFICIFIFSISLSLLFTSVVNSVNETIGSIRIPNNYFFSDFDLENPQFEIAFSLKNEGFTQISDLSINISEDIVYFNNQTEIKVNIFQKFLFIGRVNPHAVYSSIVSGEFSNFKIDALEEFWDSANMSIGVYEYLNVEIKCKFFYKLVPFRTVIGPICLSCLSN